MEEIKNKRIKKKLHLELNFLSKTFFQTSIVIQTYYFSISCTTEKKYFFSLVL